jgi:hypothetical protein
MKGTDCTGSCKSNYHTITTMMPLVTKRINQISLRKRSLRRSTNECHLNSCWYLYITWDRIISWSFPLDWDIPVSPNSLVIKNLTSARVQDREISDTQGLDCSCLWRGFLKCLRIPSLVFFQVSDSWHLNIKVLHVIKSIGPSYFDETGLSTSYHQAQTFLFLNLSTSWLRQKIFEPSAGC